jgi:hypothetical protein
LAEEKVSLQKYSGPHITKEKFPGTLTYYPPRTPQPAANIAVHENAQA